MVRMPYMIFPNSGLQVLSCVIHYFGITILTYCLSCRLAAEDFSSIQSILQMSWPRLCILLVFIDSWMFLFTSGILIFGVGLETSSAVCSMAILLCIIFYATSKLLIYAFLIEKVHVVWAPTAGQRRFNSTVYNICFVTVVLYSVVIALLFVGRINYFRNDGTCIIGLKLLSSIPLLSYDIYITVFLTALFLVPLLRAKTLNPRVKRVAMRTLVASAAALVTSTVNIVILTVLKGHELGWVCLGTCGADVICNGLVLFWVTSGAGEKSFVSSGGKGLPTNEYHAKRPATHVTNQAQINHSMGHQKRDTMYDYMSSPPVSKLSFKNQIDTLASAEIPVTRMNSRSVKISSPFLALFRKKSPIAEEHGLQVTVTTEFQVGHDHTPSEYGGNEDSVDEEERIAKAVPV